MLNLSRNICYALFRAPGADKAICISSDEPLTSDKSHELLNQSGFLIAPFHVSFEEPVWLIKADNVTSFTPNGSQPLHLNAKIDSVDYRSQYAQNFKAFHSQLLGADYTFEKLVLARSATYILGSEADAAAIFERACHLYPQQAIAAVHMPKYGTWITATPEVLVENTAPDHWHTMALAGTMTTTQSSQSSWDAKNHREQAIVARYITECLQLVSTEISEIGPVSVQAGDLLHLRTDFHFNMPYSSLGKLIKTLHPTPAICGLPQKESMKFILEHESMPRNYYSGYMGPIGMEWAGINTSLYVSLRCMHLDCDGTTAHLYAGSGIVRESKEELEWQETCAKMQTMLKCLE